MLNFIFPHLYRCGHIEGKVRRAILLRKSNDFRIFIDAATLKESTALQSSLSMALNFRIFIDAATLKENMGAEFAQALEEFPHLYRCGHIEGYRVDVHD